ncbi:MAG TPA: hypothetical protein VMC09_04435 [Anaerolineales bacterium]|nr:hypothetical protein [Anaerolineales bacterium]
MRRFSTLILAFLVLFSACQTSPGGSAASTRTPGLAPGSRCGDNICEGGETSASCPQDCASATFSGHIETTYLKVANVGNIAVMVASPQISRYPDGAGIVVVVSPIYSEVDGFMTDPDATSLGLIQVSYLWPGIKDPRTGVKSTGTFDYGGEQSTQILTDVLRFASGLETDVEGRRIFGLATVPPLTDEVGVYANVDAGIVAVNAFSINGTQLQDNVSYYIGRENPTVDTLSAMELGYYDDTNQPVANPFYVYPASYSPNTLSLNFTNLRWDPTYTDQHSSAVGRPYLDLDGNGQFSQGDFLFGWRVPIMFGKRYYSAALTKALLDNGALTTADWPSDLATPDEAAQAWQYRQSTGRFANLLFLTPNWTLKVMLVFGQNDQLQVSLDKPHVHQAFQGFRFESKLWVRLNPDRAYVQYFLPGAGLDFPDNPANTQPIDWTQIGAYAYPSQGAAARLVPLASIAEMADRTYTGLWDENLGQVLYTSPAPTPQP